MEKIMKEIIKKQITIKDITPDREDLRNAAYCSTSGDSIIDPIGIHKGRNYKRKDTMGLTKADIYNMAVSGNISLFITWEQELRVNPYKLPLSIRTMIPKDINDLSKGYRSIDDPAEKKRLITLHVRGILEPVFEKELTDGQFGGRPAKYIKKICNEEGATAQDQVASAIHKAIWDGFPFCVSIDLEDAFGNIPKKAAIKEFKDAGLDTNASKWVWRLIKIYAVDCKDRSIIYKKINKGIEQGNPLSSMVMNLVLAPIFKILEDTMNVKIFSYLDDIYIMADTLQTAESSFEQFKKIANDNGFNNVRRLWHPGDDNSSKLSQIIDLNKDMVDVLKTYKVGSSGIALHPDKIKEYLKNDLIKKNHKYSLSELMKIFNCRSLTKKACREVIPEIINKRTTMKTRDLSYRSPTGEMVGCKKDLDTCTMHISEDRHGERGEQNLYLQSTRLPDEEDFYSEYSSIEDSKSKYAYPGNYIIGNINKGIMLDTCSVPGYCTCLNQDWNDEHILLCSGCFPFLKFPYWDNQDCSTLYNELNIHNIACTCIEGGDTQDRRLVSAVEEPACLSNEDIKSILSNPKGNFDYSKHKGSVLDLRGLGEVIKADEKNIILIVNRLIKTVRVRKKATLIYDPCDSWTSKPEILGLGDDKTYKRLSWELRLDGSCLITLLHKSNLKKKKIMDYVQPPDADLIIKYVKRKSICRFGYEVRFLQSNKEENDYIETDTPSNTAGAIQAIAMVVNEKKPEKVAIRTRGLAQIAEQLSCECNPPNVVLAKCFKWLRKNYNWISMEGFAVGVRSGRNTTHNKNSSLEHQIKNM